MDLTIDYTLEVIKQIQEQATNPNIEIEVSRQRGDGHHLFEFMGKVSLGVVNPHNLPGFLSI